MNPVLTKVDNVYSCKTSLIWICLLIHLACSTSPKSTEHFHDQFTRHIRTTEPLPPEQERLSLRVPEGFEVQLFAAEPDIAKPLNMSFDTKGRMWVTSSYEYPFPDTTEKARDKISILEDTDGDGSADVIKTFADGLNIPIGIQVVPDGVVTYSIPHIWHLIDRDGDDRVDDRKVLYSGFKYNDTHRMVNNFVRSWDGWVHADHGFSNTSRVAGSDGDTIVMESGNTFRFRLDGSRVEFTTTGRVNPYGYAFDELGYTYSVDCHTSPIYQLIRGADYPHFSKKPSGIGFGPALMDHNYGSTALAGLDYYLDNRFPAAYQGNFYYGDVVRSRVSRSNFTWAGTTPVINQEEDFIVSEDPWFRPVDVKLGPDGALYIADFYNRIIGHYEVPLDHPGRDRQRGRIWRVVYTGANHHDNPHDWRRLNLQQLIEQLDHPNLPLRMSIADQIVDRFGDKSASEIKRLLSDMSGKISAKIQGLWILYRIKQLDTTMLREALEQENDTLKVHVLRIFFEMQSIDPPLLTKISELILDENPHVRRQAVMVLGKYPDADYMRGLLELLPITDTTDTHLYYCIRQSLRDQLRNEWVLGTVTKNQWADSESKILADLMVGVDGELAAGFLLKRLNLYSENLSTKIQYTKHAARWLPQSQIDALVNAIRESGDKEEDYALFKALLEGTNLGNRSIGKAGREWIVELASRLLKDPIAEYHGWKTIPIDRRSFDSNAWTLTKLDSVGTITYLSSGKIPGEGRYTSTLRSPYFVMPENLTFILRGRKNKPGEDQPETPPINYIELRSFDTDETLFREYIDEYNTRKSIKWSDNKLLNKNVYLHLVDASNAWGENIAIGDLQPPVISFPTESLAKVTEQQIFAAQMVADHNLLTLIPQLANLFDADVADILVKSEVARALLKLQNPEVGGKIENYLASKIPLKFRELLVEILSESQHNSYWKIATEHLASLSYPAQKKAIVNIGSSQAGIDFLIDAAEKIKINPRLLAEAEVAQRMDINITSKQQSRIDGLMSKVDPPDEDIDDIIAKRLRNYTAESFSVEKGQSLFSVFCSICHRVTGQGSDVAPQLDGIGNWGPYSLAEKILDPNRNINSAFKTYTIVENDGKTHFGLLRGEEGGIVTLVNAQGKDVVIQKNSIQKRVASPNTIMPGDFLETIPEEDFSHLLAYLLSLKANLIQ